MTEENDVFQCAQCNHWALAPIGETLCYVCEDQKMSSDPVICDICGRKFGTRDSDSWNGDGMWRRYWLNNRDIGHRCQDCYRVPLHPVDITADDLRGLIGRDNANIIEVGAHDGTQTVEFLKAFPKGQVFCFECEPRAIAGWRKNVSNDRAYLFEAAVSEENGKAKFHPSGGKPPGDKWKDIESWDYSGSLLTDDQHTKECDWLTFGEPFDVRTWRLDSALVFAGDSVALLWIDVQGAEAMVLRGGRATLERTEWVFLECHSMPYYHGQATFDELVSLLPEFSLHSRWGGDNYLFRRKTP